MIAVNAGQQKRIRLKLQVNNVSGQIVRELVREAPIYSTLEKKLLLFCNITQIVNMSETAKLKILRAGNARNITG